MPQITYIESGGKEHVVDVPVGYSVMEGAVRNSVPGIDAECGGCCACATCHVYVDEAWLDKLPARAEDEDAMLDCTASERKDSSRLSCQIEMSDELAGLVVRLPDAQT